MLTGNSRGQQVLCWEGWQLPPGDEAQRGRQPQCGKQQSTGEGQMVPSARDPRGGLVKKLQGWKGENKDWENRAVYSRRSEMLRGGKQRKYDRTL